MKPKLCTIMFVGLVAFAVVGRAQTNQPAADSSTPAAAAPSSTNTDAASPASTAPATPAAQPAPAAQPGDTNAMAAAQPATTDGTNAAPAAEVAAAPAAGADTNAAPAPDAIIPLIVMDDVPLTDAIKNLARQAGLNYMLDPKIGFGQLGPDGKTPLPQPTVSIRWENVTAQQALLALLNNYSLQLVEDPKSKIARITVRDPAAPDPLVTKIFQLKYASPSNIVTSVQTTLTDKRSKVVADVRTSQLVVLATDKELTEVEQLIVRLDTPTRQVLIEARLLETLFEPSTSKGIDWSGTLQAQNLHFGNNLQVNSPNASVNNTLSQTLPKLLFDTSKGFNPATAFLDADGVSAVLSFLNTYAETKVISSPRTVTLDNSPAEIEVGTMFPIVNTTAGTANTTGGSTVTYSNLTVRLDVTPRISANNYINLKVAPRVMRLGDIVSSVVGGVQNNVFSFSTRRIDTTVLIPSGNTLVMGGLVEDNIHNQDTKVPLLGDIPGLGQLFRSDSKSRQKSNLLVFLTPTIVQDEDFQPTRTEFLKTPVPVKDQIEGDWSAWNSGKPKDWSKPENKGSDN